MAMAMALRRLSSSIDKPIRPLIRSTSCYMSSLPSEAVDEKERSRVTVSLSAFLYLLFVYSFPCG